MPEKTKKAAPGRNAFYFSRNTPPLAAGMKPPKDLPLMQPDFKYFSAIKRSLRERPAHNSVKVFEMVFVNFNYQVKEITMTKIAPT
jgi:Glu-tRNA(Gln) amidotransferase subunit E-like FAD-binding protein